VVVVTTSSAASSPFNTPGIAFVFLRAASTLSSVISPPKEVPTFVLALAKAMGSIRPNVAPKPAASAVSATLTPSATSFSRAAAAASNRGCSSTGSCGMTSRSSCA